MSDLENNRLTRIEVKLDSLTEVISKLAVVDARLTDFIAANSRTSIRLSEVEKQLNIVETGVEVQKIKVSSLERISNILSGTVVTALCASILKVVGII